MTSATDRLREARAIDGSAPQGGGEGIRTVTVASPGGSVMVNVGPNESSVTIANATTGASVTIPVAPGKDTQIPIPNVPGGTVLTISIGVGTTARIIVVQVIAPSP
ncbi:MAG: hypothetical protein FJ265_06170 [Planctomycetes bacterium]|nr:hypothetical protein [Planctomycetota bacterium]